MSAIILYYVFESLSFHLLHILLPSPFTSRPWLYWENLARQINVHNSITAYCDCSFVDLAKSDSEMISWVRYNMPGIMPSPAAGHTSLQRIKPRFLSRSSPDGSVFQHTQSLTNPVFACCLRFMIPPWSLSAQRLASPSSSLKLGSLCSPQNHIQPTF